MIPVKTVPGTKGEEMKERGGGGKFSKIYSIHCKNICKHSNVPYPAQQ
jgi:hypothetical protein